MKLFMQYLIKSLDALPMEYSMYCQFNTTLANTPGILQMDWWWYKTHYYMHTFLMQLY